MRPSLRWLPLTAIFILPGCRNESVPLEPGAPVAAAAAPTASEPEPALATTATLAPLVFQQVTAGDGFTCGLTTGGLAYCWGSNEVGALGIGDSPGPEACSGLPCSTTPVRVVGGLVFRQLSAGRVHACGVTPNNRLFCWGHNHTGQLGDGTAADSPRPIRVARGLAFRQVSAGDLHTCAVTTDGAAYCWGHNQLGPLGDGTTDGSSLPVRVVGGLAFREVAAGNQFTCGVTTADVAYCWGAGIGNNTGESCFGGDGFSPCSTRPVRVLRRLPFSRLSAGLGHVCGVTTEAVAYCWGSNEDGQLGHDTLPGLDPSTGVCSPADFCASEKPVRVVGGLAFGSVSAGQSHTCGVTTDHVAYCWGENFFGQLGTGDDTGPEDCPLSIGPCSARPVRVVGGLAFSEVAAGVSHTCGVTTAGEAGCWGDNEFGQLGDGTTQDRLRPRRVGGGS